MKITLQEAQLRKLIRSEIQKIMNENEGGLENAFNTIDDLQQNFIKSFNEITGKKWARKIKMLKFDENIYSFILVGDGNMRFKIEWNFKLPKEKYGMFKISPLKKLIVGNEFSEMVFTVIAEVINNKAKFEPILKELSDLMEKGGMVEPVKTDELDNEEDEEEEVVEPKKPETKKNEPNKKEEETPESEEKTDKKDKEKK